MAIVQSVVIHCYWWDITTAGRTENGRQLLINKDSKVFWSDVGYVWRCRTCRLITSLHRCTVTDAMVALFWIEITISVLADVTSIPKINQIKVDLWLMPCSSWVEAWESEQQSSTTITQPGPVKDLTNMKTQSAFKLLSSEQTIQRGSLSDENKTVSVKRPLTTWQTRLADTDKPGSPQKSNSAKRRGRSWARLKNAACLKTQAPNQNKTARLQSALVIMCDAAGCCTLIIFIID